MDLPANPPNACKPYARFLKPNDYDWSVVYRVGEHVVVSDTEYTEREWVATITHILVYGPIQSLYYYFMKGDFLAAVTHRGEVSHDSWTGQALMVRKNYQRYTVYPLECIDRKVMLYPSGNNFLTIDPDNLVSCTPVHIPYVSKPGDVVLLSSEPASVINVTSVSSSTATGYQLVKVRGHPPRYKRGQLKTVTFQDIKCVVQHHKNAGCYYFLN